MSAGTATLACCRTVDIISNSATVVKGKTRDILPCLWAMYDFSRLSFLALPPLILSIIPSIAQQTSVARILIYSATREFRHDSIPTAIQAIKANQSAINAVFDNTEDQTQFNDQILAQYDALVFLDNTGEGDSP
jgi:hypothetical protein